MRATASKQRAAELRRAVGDPNAVAKDLRRFRRDAKLLSSNHLRFIDEYPEKWVAVCNGNVVAADSLDDLLEEVDARGIPRGQVIVRHIDREERVMIL